MTENKLPRTDSIQELARFWDSHELTEFDGELEEVQEPAFERGTVVSVRLSPDEMESIRGMAFNGGGPSGPVVGGPRGVCEGRGAPSLFAF
jgi:hypothetical protein